MKKKRKRNIEEIIGKIVLLSFIVPMGFIVYKIIVSPVSNELNQAGIKVKSDYILMLSQCILGIIALILPQSLSKKIKLEIPPNMYMVYMLFLWSSIFLGEIRNFYYNVPHWDTILHVCSGAMLGALGFSFINLLNKNDVAHLKLSPFFVAFFSFCFAMTLGSLWEIYEFVCDALIGTNMQKYALETGENLVGHLALVDTIKDLIVDGLGAVVMCSIGYISLKNKNGWYENLLIKPKKIRNKKTQEI